MARISEWAAIVACGLVPLLGLVFLGWNTATVIFMLWLDAYLTSLRMIPANVYVIKRDVERDPLDPVNPLIDRICLIGLGIVVWMFLALPVTIAGKYLHDMVSRLQPGGFEAEAYDLIFDAPWSFAVLIGGRVYQSTREFAVARAIGPTRFVEMIKALFGLLLCKGTVLFALAGFSPLFVLAGPRGTEIFVGMAIIALVAVELYAIRWFRPALRVDANPPTKKHPEIVHGFDGRK